MLHGTNGAHATVALVAAALEQHDFTGRFFGTGKHATHHHGASPCGNGFGDVAAVADAAVSNQGHTRAFECGGHAVHSHDLRHAHTRHDAGGADGAGADAHFHAVGTGFDQGQGRSARGDIAANDFNVRVVLLDPTHAVEHAFAVAVRGVHHDGVHASARQCLDAFFGALAHAHSGAHAQLACGIACGVGEVELFGDVLDGDQALELKGVVDHQKAFQLVFVEQVLGLLGGRAFGHGDQTLTRGHDFADLLVIAGLKAQITAGDDADDLSTIADREAGHAQLVAQGHDLAHRGVGGNDDRVAQNTRFVTLDLGHLGGLFLRREVFVHDANAAFLRNGNGQTRFGDRVHGGRHQGQVQADVAGELRRKRRVLGQDLGVSGDEENVVKSKGFTE